MLFSSTVFLFLFLPIVGLVYCLLPNGGGKDLRLRNIWLLVSSLFFYAWGEPTFVLMMLASIVWNYVFGLIVSGRKAFLAVSIVGNVLFIGAYKYLNFLTANIREYLPCAVGVIPQTSILLPIGISFFTFQAMSYVVDVYRGMPAQKNPLTLALYISLFPQLVAGPIVRYSTVARQLAVRCSTVESVSAGLIRFVIGFNKKMLLANPLRRKKILMLNDSFGRPVSALLSSVYEEVWAIDLRFVKPTDVEDVIAKMRPDIVCHVINENSLSQAAFFLAGRGSDEW